MIPAHDSPLAALAFDASGTKLATASEKVCGLISVCWFKNQSLNPSINIRYLFFFCFFFVLSRERSFASFLFQRARSCLSSGGEWRGNGWKRNSSISMIQSVISHCRQRCENVNAFVCLLLDVWVSARWPSVWKDFICLLQATQRRFISSSWRHREKSTS